MSNRLIAGVQEFQRSAYPEKKELFEKLAGGQQPHSAFITCSDSRIDPYLLTSSEPGDIFVIRTAGNIVPPKGSSPSGMSATIEYAVSGLKVPNIVVCGHALCGAMDALTRPETMQNLDEVRGWMDHAGAVGAEINEMGPFQSNQERIETAVKKNVILQLEHLKTYDFVQKAMAENQLILLGWYYDFATGWVESYDAEKKQFVEL